MYPRAIFPITRNNKGGQGCSEKYCDMDMLDDQTLSFQGRVVL